MNELIPKILDKVTAKRLIPYVSEVMRLPLPAINKVELYLSFHGNDRCAHCITCSGPDREELMQPETALKAVKNVADHSILGSLRKIFIKGMYHCDRPAKCKSLDTTERPPEELTDTLICDYANCIMGKGFTSEWIYKTKTYPLPFGRPSIRLSGGEFYTWPHRLNNKSTSEDERLFYQKELLDYIRHSLPEYDIWILTNGRFAESKKKADKVIRHWAPEDAGCCDKSGRTRISVSIDAFHRPPKNSTTEQMLTFLWEGTKKYHLCAPYIYSITNKKIFLVGRALNHFSSGTIPREMITNVSCSHLNECDYLYSDPHNLIKTDGCNELKGFVCRTPYGVVLTNNIVINYSGHLAYCCVCVGDYGDFINTPQKALKQIIKDPVSLMLRNGENAAKLLNLACDMDPSIKTFGNSRYERTTGSTCYQVLSGKRVAKGKREWIKNNDKM